jgi:hypothetical protein
MWGCGLDLSGLGKGQVVDVCECGNETSSSIKCGEFLDQLRTGWFARRIQFRGVVSKLLSK